MAFDNRVDRAGDYADFVKTTAPYTKAVFRQVFEFKSDLSTADYLEQRKPTNSIEAYNVNVYQGKEISFEKVLSRLKKSIETEKLRLPYSVYKLISGGEHTTYMIMVHRENFAYYDDKSSFKSLSEQIIKLVKPKESNQLQRDLTESIKSISSETWGYRADLSLIPKQ